MTKLRPQRRIDRIRKWYINNPRKRFIPSLNNHRGQRLRRIASITKARQVCSNSHSNSKIHIFHLKWRLLKVKKICLRNLAKRTVNRQNQRIHRLQCFRALVNQILLIQRVAAKRLTGSAIHRLIHQLIPPGIYSDQNLRLNIIKTTTILSMVAKIMVARRNKIIQRSDQQSQRILKVRRRQCKIWFRISSNWIPYRNNSF